MNDKHEIIHLYEDMYVAMINKNRVELERLHDDSFVLVHMTGMRQTKKIYIDSIINGTLNYYSAQHENIQVKIIDDTAKLTGQSRVSAEVFGGGRHTWRLQLECQLIKRNDNWYFTLATASTY